MKLTRKNIVEIIFIICAFVYLIFQQVSISRHDEGNKSSEEVSEESTQSTQSTQSANLYKVVKVVDGDTIDVVINGKAEKVRLLGINAPESVDPRRPDECFGNEASKYVKDTLLNKPVYLEGDTSQGDVDKYNRLLRYIFLEDGTNFNMKLIFSGYAYEYTYDKPYKFQKEFKTAETLAKENNLGLWSKNTCNGQK